MGKGTKNVQKTITWFMDDPFGEMTVVVVVAVDDGHFTTIL